MCETFLTLPNKPILKKKIKELFAGDNNVALLYFSGHGSIEATGGYIVTPDYEEHDLGITMDEVLSLANQSKARNKVIILDCCHSGAFGSPALTGSQIATLSNGLTVLTASRGSESAIEFDGHGIFTALLLDALKGGAADLMGYITLGSVYSYIDQALGAWDQRPIFKTNVSRFTPLRQVIPKVPLETLRKICEHFPDPKSPHPLDPSYEDTEIDHDEGKTQIFKELQKLESVGLVVPVGEDHMYYAAINSKGCQLTAYGQHYWRLAKEGRI